MRRFADRESVEEFRRLFAEAIELRLQGDQAPGVYLSGGLDSTAVATQAARLSGRPVKAFTVAFDDPAYDESTRAAATARQHTLDHHIVTIPAAGLAPHFLRSLLALRNAGGERAWGGQVAALRPGGAAREVRPHWRGG